MKKTATTYDTAQQTCKQCGEKYTVWERNRVYGTNPLMQGYCSAGCYTQGMLMKSTPDPPYYIAQEVHKHTPGKLIIDKRGNKIFIEAIGKDNGGESAAYCIAQMYGNEKVDEADAARIVQCWNEYDGLKDGINKMAEALGKYQPKEIG